MSPPPRGARPPGPGEARIAEVIDRTLNGGRPLRLKLPGGGELQVDRPLPFLFAYEPPSGRKDPWTSRLLKSEASIWFPSKTLDPEEMRGVLLPVLRTLVEEFGALLVVEVRAGSRTSVGERNRFTITEHPLAPDEEVLSTLAGGLGRIRIRHSGSTVERKRASRATGAIVELMGRELLAELGVHVIRVSVPPVYRDEEGQLYPLVLRSFRRQLVRALRRTAHRFSQIRARRSPTSYLALGRRRIVRAVLDADRRLEELASGFDYLMLITPTNVQESWEAFRDGGFRQEPRFRYRPIPIDPGLFKRRLHEIPIERIADPALGQIYEDRRYEFDVRLSMLQQRGGRKHLLAGLQLYGEIDPRTEREAEEILALPVIEEGTGDDAGGDGAVDAEAFARRVRSEFGHYRRLDPEFHSEVRVRRDLGSILVSRGRVHVDRYLRLPPERLEALVAHEVGTHVLTFHNGERQPLRIFATGLAGYEELQEGLAVLGEYLVGGLTLARLRLLAGRVIAAREKLRESSFVETFRLLHEGHGFSPRSAFLTSMRAHRGGGALKDVIYLRGLSRLLQHRGEGGDLETLYLGKFAQAHLPLVEELLERRILIPPKLIPRSHSGRISRLRLERIRAGSTVSQLITHDLGATPR